MVVKKILSIKHSSTPTAVTITLSSTPCPSGTAGTTTTPAAPTWKCVKLPTLFAASTDFRQ